MMAIGMLMEILRSFREWHIGNPYSKGYGNESDAPGL